MGTRLSPRDKTLLLILLVAAWGFGLYHFLLAPQWQAYARTKAELATAGKELAGARLAAASLSSERLKLERAREAMARVEKPFATEMRDGAAVILLGLRSAAADLQVTGIEPGPIKTNPHTLEIPLKVTVEGGYPELISFIDKVENLTLANLAEFRSLKITSAGTSGAAAPATPQPGQGVSRVRAELGLVIYSAKTPQGRLQLEQLAGWLEGRPDVFAPAGATPPVPGLAGHLKLPAPPAPSATVTVPAPGGSVTTPPSPGSGSPPAAVTPPLPTGKSGSTPAGPSSPSSPGKGGN